METEGSLKFPIILMTMLVVIFRIDKGICSTTSEFQIYRDKAAAVPTVISSEEVVSLIHCASLCNSNQLCKSFSLDCLKVMSSRQICKLHSSSVSNVIDLVPSDTCYIQKTSASPIVTTSTTTPTAGTSTPTTGTTSTTTPTAGTSTPTTGTTSTTTPTAGTSTPTTGTTSTTTPTAGTSTPTTETSASTTTTTVAPALPTVIDMVYGPHDMCPGGLSNQDFLVLTTAGVYVYDDITDLTIAPCDGPVSFTSIFQGYGSIPTIEMTKGILIFQSSNVELYSGGTVYKWQIESGNLNNVLGSLTYSAHLGTTDLDDKDFKWAAHRQGSSVERHFYLGNDEFLLRSSQHGTKTFNKTDEVFDNNGFNMNPWSAIPTDTVAVAGYGSESNKDYALVNSSGYVYTYHLDHAPNNNNPTKALTQQGLMKF